MGGKWCVSRTAVDTDLPADIREGLIDIVIEGATLDEAAEWLRERGYDISRTSIGRWRQNFYPIYQKYVTFRAQTRALRSEAGESLASSEVLAQMLEQQVFEAVINDELDVAEAPKVLGELAKLQRVAIEREKLKRDLADRAREAAGEVEKIVEKAGLSDSARGEIRGVLMGAFE